MAFGGGLLPAEVLGYFCVLDGEFVDRCEAKEVFEYEEALGTYFGYELFSFLACD